MIVAASGRRENRLQFGIGNLICAGVIEIKHNRSRKHQHRYTNHKHSELVDREATLVALTVPLQMCCELQITTPPSSENLLQAQ